MQLGGGGRAVSSPTGPGCGRRSPAARQVLVYFQLKGALLAIKVIDPSYTNIKTVKKDYGQSPIL